jgi:hypothetical protein
MATGTLTAALTVGVPADRTERYVTYYGDLTVSAVGDTYATGGVTCSLRIKGINHSNLPERVEIWDETAGAGYEYRYIFGSTIANGLVMILGHQPAAATSGILPLDELGSGVAFNAANVVISTASAAGKLKFKATFSKK